MKADMPDLFHPKRLYKEIFDNVGPAQASQSWGDALQKVGLV